MKNKKKKNLNNFKEIYKKVNHNKYSQITNISGKAELKSNLKNFIYNYKILLIILLTIFLILLIYTFKSNPIVILYCLGFLLAFILLIMYSCTYRVTLDENALNLYINFQQTTIKSDDLVNIYISKQKMHFLGFPIYNYLLNIIYVNNDSPLLISLPTVMINRKKLVKFLSIIETKKIKDEEEEIIAKEKNNKIVIITIISVIAIFILVSAILVVIFSNNF